jgi:MFS family permease
VREPLFTARFLRLLAFGFLAFFAGFQLFPSMPFRLLELGASRAAAGSFLTVYTWASALSAPLTGALADRWGRRRMLLWAAIAFAVFSLLYGLVRSLPLLLAVGALHGVFWSGMLSASGALAADAIPLARRTEGLGVYGMAPTAAIAVAPAVGLAVYRLGWLALALELVLCSLLLVLLARLVHEDRARSPLALPVAGPAATPRWRRKVVSGVSWRVVAVASTIFLVVLGYGGTNSYAAMLAVERGIRPASLFFTAFALAVLASRLLLMRIADRRGPLYLLYPGLLLVPIGFVLLARAQGVASLLVAAVVFGTGFGAAFPAFMTWVLARTDPERRATTFGSVLLAQDTAIGCGSLLVGHIGAVAGLGNAFLVAAGVSALALPAFLVTRGLLPPPDGS